jgi:hypothetical protein
MECKIVYNRVETSHEYADKKTLPNDTVNNIEINNTDKIERQQN